MPIFELYKAERRDSARRRFLSSRAHAIIDFHTYSARAIAEHFQR